jgi:DNA mismatch repair protein MutS
LKTPKKSTEKASAETPLMKQYNEIKARYPDALLLFRVGDFYETFGEDAVRSSKILGIVLTKRANGAASSVELAGFPHHALETYLPKLVRAGLRVAICDQLEDPKLTKTIVKRGVTELVTPGLVSSDKLLEHQRNHFLAAFHFGPKQAGLALLDHSTGEFLIAEGRTEAMLKLVHNFQPGEILVAKPQNHTYKEHLGDRFFNFLLDDWVFQDDYARKLLLEQFGTVSLKGFGVDLMEAAIRAAGACLHYLRETSHDKTRHITSISRIEEDRHIWMDGFTVRNLELLAPMHPEGQSLFDILNACDTPMGSRLLRRWIALPLKDTAPINERLNLVEFFIQNTEQANQVSEHLRHIGDLERIVAKAAVQRIAPRELLSLKRALEAIKPIKQVCSASENTMMQRIGEQLQPCDTILKRIQAEIVDDPPAALHKGDVIAPGVDATLDELRGIKTNGKEYLLAIQHREAERTGISSLKVSYNNVFGYYLEVTNAHKDKVPTDWIRKQTLVNAERYITPEIKTFEEKILGAEEKIAQIESRLYTELVAAVAEYIQPIQHNAYLLAQLDCLHCFANQALRYNYVKPEVDDSFVLELTEARHPVIERQMKPGEAYISNDLKLDPHATQVMMITGPNMSGKSALLRQTALITIMAQMGCFVPAERARIGLVDKIFTRVGASDSISTGESTFMVEMNETASIVNNLSSRSLILLDEIGRGTSTYDGLSIAWSIAEYLHEQTRFRARTLFATHYHELNDMTLQFPRIQNFHVAVKEVNQTVLFLRKLKPGGTNHSFGIHVARMAGMPQRIVDRAGEMLVELEQMHRKQDIPTAKKKVAKESDTMQLSFFQLDDPVLLQIREELERIDINNLTPVEALLKLESIKRLTGGK